jgi:hypothetical protein
LQSDVALRGFAAIQRIIMGLPAADDFSALAERETDSRSLLLAAVQTKDPEPLFNAGLAQGYINNFNGDATKNELAWWLVACQRGLPCDSNSEFQRDVALNDSLLEELSGPSYLRDGGQGLSRSRDASARNKRKTERGSMGSIGFTVRLGPVNYAFIHVRLEQGTNQRYIAPQLGFRSSSQTDVFVTKYAAVWLFVPKPGRCGNSGTTAMPRFRLPYCYQWVPGVG